MNAFFKRAFVQTKHFFDYENAKNLIKSTYQDLNSALDPTCKETKALKDAYTVLCDVQECFEEWVVFVHKKAYHKPTKR